MLIVFQARQRWIARRVVTSRVPPPPLTVWMPVGPLPEGFERRLRGGRNRSPSWPNEQSWNVICFQLPGKQDGARHAPEFDPGLRPAKLATPWNDPGMPCGFIHMRREDALMHPNSGRLPRGRLGSPRTPATYLPPNAGSRALGRPPRRPYAKTILECSTKSATYASGDLSHTQISAPETSSGAVGGLPLDPSLPLG